MMTSKLLLATLLLSQSVAATAAFTASSTNSGFLSPSSVRNNGASAAVTSKKLPSALTWMFHEEKDSRSSSRLCMSKSNKASQSKDSEILDLINGNDDDDEEEEEDFILQLNGEMEFDLEGENAEMEDTEESEESKKDKQFMQQAIQMASSAGGERGSHGPFPRPICGAILVAKDGRILGKGRSTYAGHAIEFAFQEAGINATPLREWCVAWPSDGKFRKDISESTLYVTLEPSNERQGEEKPPITQLVEMAQIPRLVIGCQDPIAENASKGAASLHAAGVSVTMGILQDECNHLIESYANLCKSKVHRMARHHFRIHGRPMGHLHCSVIDSDDAEAFARNGNSFGKNFGGQHLSYRDFGTYEIAPPPESIWAVSDDDMDEFSSEVDDFFTMDFEEENSQETLGKNPMMPWYEQVDACVATFPKPGNGPVNDPTLQARLRGLKWLATHGKLLPAGVERILVMDATDLKDLPLKNDDPNLPPGVDVEEFWKGEGRKPTRVLLRHGDNAMAIAVAKAAAKAAAAAAEASAKAKSALETGDAELAAEAALECQKAAMASNEFIQKEIQKTQDLKQRLIKLGARVEVLKGSKPIDVMDHLGKRSGYHSVVWRAGCWGGRGVEAIQNGAFQRVSAHLAVDAIGGKFWQLMLAERALQSACGAEREIKVFADEQDGINLEYCDREDADKDCNLLFDGRPVRHVRIDARVAVIDEIKRQQVRFVKTVPIKKFREEEAPWFM